MRDKTNCIPILLKKGRGGNKLQRHNYNCHLIKRGDGEVLRKPTVQSTNRWEGGSNGCSASLRRKQACCPIRHSQVSTEHLLGEGELVLANNLNGVKRLFGGAVEEAYRRTPLPTAGCWWACQRHPAGSCRCCAGWCSGWWSR